MYQINIFKYLNIKYKFGGRKYPYLDCFGLVMCFYRDELNIQLPLEQSICDASTDNENILKQKVKYTEVKECDICNNRIYIACFYHAEEFRHCGVVVNKKILHTSQLGTAYQSISDCKIRFNLWGIKYYEVAN